MPPDRDKDPSEARCVCGNLLARITEHGVEVKCRRCKRVVLIPFENPGEPRPPPDRS